MDPFVILGLSFVSWCALIGIVVYYVARLLWDFAMGFKLFASMFNNSFPEGE